MRAAARLLPALLALGGAAVAAPPRAPLFPQTIETRPATVGNHAPDARLGAIRLLGALEIPPLKADGLRLTELSGLAWDSDDQVLYALSDQGRLFHLRPRFERDRLAGLELLAAVPLRELRDGKPLRWLRSDSEGLDIRNGRNGIKGDAELIVSFEREPRIVGYRPDGTARRDYPLPAALRDTGRYRNPNRALEAVALTAAHGIVTVAEQPLRDERRGFSRLFALSGPSWVYPVGEHTDITALEPLGTGLLVLERDHKPAAGGSVTTLRRVRTLPAEDGAVLTPETVASLRSEGFVIDNFEGLTRHEGSRFFMVTDNNDAFLQRTVLLYFELLDDSAPRTVP